MVTRHYHTPCHFAFATWRITGWFTLPRTHRFVDALPFRHTTFPARALATPSACPCTSLPSAFLYFRYCSTRVLLQLPVGCRYSTGCSQPLRAAHFPFPIMPAATALRFTRTPVFAYAALRFYLRVCMPLRHFVTCHYGSGSVGIPPDKHPAHFAASFPQYTTNDALHLPHARAGLTRALFCARWTHHCPSPHTTGICPPPLPWFVYARYYTRCFRAVAVPTHRATHDGCVLAAVVVRSLPLDATLRVPAFLPNGSSGARYTHHTYSNARACGPSTDGSLPVIRYTRFAGIPLLPPVPHSSGPSWAQVGGPTFAPGAGPPPPPIAVGHCWNPYGCAT